MNKKIIALLTALLIILSSMTVVFAESELPRVVDTADILASQEEADLLAQIDEISERQQFDVVIYTVQTLDGYSAQDYADDLYDYNGYGFGSSYDGALLLIAIDEGEWHISTCGYGIDALTDAGIDYIGEQMLSYLSDGDFYTAFITYADLCDDFVTQAKNGTPFDVENLPKEPFSVFGSFVLALIIGLVIALVVSLVLKGQLKSVRFKSAAADYEIPGSMKLTDSREYFLYRNISRQKKAENNSGGSSTHTSSSGRTHGGGGGKF